MTASTILASLRGRLVEAKIDSLANKSIAAHLLPGDLDAMQETIAFHVVAILKALAIDVASDHNTRGTAARVAKMYVREVFAGRFTAPPRLTDFPNAENLDQLYTVGPTAVRSCCAHHLCPIEGEAWVGIVPSARVIGLSKFARLTRHVMARPQIQEEATVQLADAIAEAIQPLGLGVVVKARHTCMSWRGVMEGASTMTTSVMRGALRDKAEARAEFFSMIGAQGFQCR